MSCAGYRANGVNSNQTAAITDRSREKEMNIQEAKEEICNTVRAYLAKDEDGYYVYPLVRQRPILLIGPPGIGENCDHGAGGSRVQSRACILHDHASYQTECHWSSGDCGAQLRGKRNDGDRLYDE